MQSILRDKSGSYQYLANGDNHILNVNYLPEIKWYLFVEQNEEAALAGVRRTLYANLGISLAVTLLVLFLAHLVLSRYQRRIEQMASTDELTGLLNRHAFTVLIDKLLAEYRRTPQPIAMLQAEPPDQTVNRADAALHAAKNSGCNRVEVAAPPTTA